MSVEELQRLLLEARQALKGGQAARALAAAQAALLLDPRNALALFTLGQVHGALGDPAAAADAFRRCVQLTAGAAPGSQRHQLHVAASENMLLQSEAALPPSWIPLLHDAPRLAALQGGIAAAVRRAGAADGGGATVLVCGGLGLEAVLAAQAGAAAVAAYCPANPLAASMAAELAADSGCGSRVAAATTLDQLGQLNSASGPYSLVILADALGPSIDWQLLRSQLVGAGPWLAAAPAVLPHAVAVRGQLVECAGVVALNEVNAQQLAADTGGLDLAPANRLLPRARRSVRLPAYQHAQLSSAATLLTVPLASLLPGNEPAGDCSCQAAVAASLAVTAPGAADALCWWLEQQLGPPVDEGQQAAWLSAAPGAWQPAAALLHPHVWQHLQYLDQRQLSPGQAVGVRCMLGGGPAAAAAGDAAGALQALSLEAGSTGGKPSRPLELRLEVQLGGASLLLPTSAEQEAVAAAVPRYHTSMLNDSARTAAYHGGIAAALREAHAAAEAAAAAQRQPAQAPLVLEIGSGSGLLCLLACQAGARRVVGCERLPELQRAAARLLEANGLADRVTVAPKHSRELTVAGAAGGAGGAAADLQRRADVLLHEIFGTDPFSEGVVPTLAHARQHLLRPGAVLAPCRLRVLAAVAASASLHRLLRPPAAVCGGAVATGALAQLAPRKVDCQVGEAGDLLLLTQPTPVLSVDFAADDLLLADSSTALLECLPQPQPLAAWVAAQGGGPAAGPAAAAAAGDCGSAGQLAAAAASGDACTLYAVGWFEYEFPGGVAGCSAPHLQCSEHWQQVVQPLGGAAAGAALERLVGGGGGGAGVAGLLLTAGYRVDRLWFELEGLAARKRTAPDGSAEGHSP